MQALVAAHKTAIFPAPMGAAPDFSDASASREFARSSAEKLPPNACTPARARGRPHFLDTAAHRKARNKPHRLFSKGGHAPQTFLARKSQDPASSRSHTRPY